MSKKKEKKQQISLRNILALQMKVAGINYEEDAFEDKSSSWILIKGNSRNES